jgi:hypothetical protein
VLGDLGYAQGIDTTRIGGFRREPGRRGDGAPAGLGYHLEHHARVHIDRARSAHPRRRAYVPYSGQSFLPAFCEGQSGAAAVDRPFLAISGTADITAPIGMTERAVNLMRNSRYLVELVGGEHELRPQDAGDVLTWMVTFFNAYLDVRTDIGAMGRFIRMKQVTGGRVDNLIVDVHVPFANVAGEVRAVEFHNTFTDHYFQAAGQGEIDGILAGAAGPGWELTGESFKVWPQMPSDTTVAPVCRFYGVPAGGPNSHFFTASTSECDIVKRPGSGWFYEGIGFYIRPVGNPRVVPVRLPLRQPRLQQPRRAERFQPPLHHQRLHPARDGEQGLGDGGHGDVRTTLIGIVPPRLTTKENARAHPKWHRQLRCSPAPRYLRQRGRPALPRLPDPRRQRRQPVHAAAPCRLLPAALAAVASGGEVWMLDSANYNTAR